jgi:hypothetical protein
MSKICNVSTSPTTVKYKFGTQVPRGVRSVISLGKGTKIIYGNKKLTQNSSNLQVIKTSIVLDSGEDIPKGLSRST